MVSHFVVRFGGFRKPFTVARRHPSVFGLASDLRTDPTRPRARRGAPIELPFDLGYGEQGTCSLTEPHDLAQAPVAFLFGFPVPNGASSKGQKRPGAGGPW